ncbi:MAG TPA: hypothetical protein VLY20_04320 [Nitrospiria bacterium]|nr:hypothetical protein [Nitrospiria bacterium]
MSAQFNFNRTSQRLLWGGVAGLLFAAAVVTSAQAPANVLQLITNEDVLRQNQTAKEKGLTEVGRSMLLELKDGPEIDVVRPGGGEIGQQPVEIDVEFKQSKDGAEPNMSTLKVRYIKFFTIDITDRVKPYVVANRIHATEAQFPKGDHTVELYVEDTHGKASSKVIEFKVL